jgi:hypothetical protein
MDKIEPLQRPTGADMITSAENLVPGNIVMHHGTCHVITCTYTKGDTTRLGLRPLSPRLHSYVIYAKPDDEVVTYSINLRPKRRI